MNVYMYFLIANLTNRTDKFSMYEEDGRGDHSIINRIDIKSIQTETETRFVVPFQLL